MELGLLAELELLAELGLLEELNTLLLEELVGTEIVTVVLASVSRERV